MWRGIALIQKEKTVRESRARSLGSVAGLGEGGTFSNSFSPILNLVGPFTFRASPEKHRVGFSPKECLFSISEHSEMGMEEIL